MWIEPEWHQCSQSWWMVPSLFGHIWHWKFQFVAAVALQHLYTIFPSLTLSTLGSSPALIPSHPPARIDFFCGSVVNGASLYSQPHSSETVKQEMRCSAAGNHLHTAMRSDRLISATCSWSLGSLPTVDLWWKYITESGRKTYFYFLPPRKTGPSYLR